MSPFLKNLSPSVNSTSHIEGIISRLQNRDYVGNGAQNATQSNISEARFPGLQNESIGTESSIMDCSCPAVLSGGAIAGITVASFFAFFLLVSCVAGSIEIWCQCKMESMKQNNEGKIPEAGTEFEGNTKECVDPVSAVLGMATSTPTRQQLQATDGSLSETSATTAAQKFANASSVVPPPPSARREHGANAPDMGPRMEELLERQRKLQERRNRLLELERLDREEDNLQEQLRRAG